MSHRSPFYPDSLIEPIKQWLDQNCRVHSYFFGGELAKGNYVGFESETDAVFFKMRWGEEIADAEQQARTSWQKRMNMVIPTLREDDQLGPLRGWA